MERAGGIVARTPRAAVAAQRTLALALALALAPGAARAQAQPEPARAPALVRWGKWAAAAAFAGFTVQGILRHHDADDAYDRLVRYCRSGGSCLLGPGGTYPDGRSEALYQESVRGDRAARAWLVAGQVALVGAAALFIVELNYDRGTRNIPYEPRAYVAPGRDGVLVGMRIALRR